MTLTRQLASKGWNEEDRRDIFNFIVRAVNLKDVELKQKFTRVIEEGDGYKMTLSFVEEYFLNKGVNEGGKLLVGAKKNLRRRVVCERWD